MRNPRLTKIFQFKVTKYLMIVYKGSSPNTGNGW